MKHTSLLMICSLLCSTAYAGGSITWDEVRSRLAKSDPEIVKKIEENFTIDRGGMGTRLGNQFGDRVGERIPPYDFYATRKPQGEKYLLEFVESPDFEFTGRYQFTWQIMPKQ